jgi:pSer/pThr/pTyr-binding forkhead associated (FHA) protein
VHFAIIWDGRNAAAKDLKSTNGTRIAGRPISEIAIQGDTQIQAGTNTFVFKVVARTINNDMAVSE